MYDCIPHAYLVPEGGQRVPDPPELELQMVVELTGNQTWIL